MSFEVRGEQSTHAHADRSRISSSYVLSGRRRLTASAQTYPSRSRPSHLRKPRVSKTVTVAKINCSRFLCSKRAPLSHLLAFQR